jgi:hypothetical protein
MQHRSRGVFSLIKLHLTRTLINIDFILLKIVTDP